jgi:assimilatory nitrate reductase catalytic subunit
VAARLDEVFIEHARLSGHHNEGERWFDISGLASLDRAGYDAFSPIQWPVNERHPYGKARLFGDGGFPAPNRRGRLLPLRLKGPVNPPTAEYPLILNTGRIRDQWHTMTRTGKTPRLTNHIPEPFVEVHPHEAGRFGLADALWPASPVATGKRWRGSRSAPTSGRGRYSCRCTGTSDSPSGA